MLNRIKYSKRNPRLRYLWYLWRNGVSPVNTTPLARLKSDKICKPTTNRLIGTQRLDSARNLNHADTYDRFALAARYDPGGRSLPNPSDVSPSQAGSSQVLQHKVAGNEDSRGYWGWDEQDGDMRCVWKDRSQLRQSRESQGRERQSRGGRGRGTPTHGKGSSWSFGLF